MPALVASGSLSKNGHFSAADGLRAVLTEPNLFYLDGHFRNWGRNNRRRYFNLSAARTAPLRM